MNLIVVIGGVSFFIFFIMLVFMMDTYQKVFEIGGTFGNIIRFIISLCILVFLMKTLIFCIGLDTFFARLY